MITGIVALPDQNYVDGYAEWRELHRRNREAAEQCMCQPCATNGREPEPAVVRWTGQHGYWTLLGPECLRWWLIGAKNDETLRPRSVVVLS
jgi:hypothetical protein